MDEFNLKGIKKYFPNFKKIWLYILDFSQSEEEEEGDIKEHIENEENKIEDIKEIKKNAPLLYALIHARFIQTQKGLKMIVF